MRIVHPTLSADESSKAAQMSGIDILDGKFVAYDGIGEFCDPATGLIFKGCKAEINPVTKKIVRLIEPSPPVQLPTHRWCSYQQLYDFEKRTVSKESVVLIAGREMCKVKFSTKTSDERTSGLLLAFRCGTLRYVDQKEMEELWPVEWAARKDEIVLDDPRHPNEEFGELLDDLMQSRRVSLAQEQASRSKK